MVVRFFEKKEQAGTWIREKKEQVKEEVEKKRSSLLLFFCAWWCDFLEKRSKLGVDWDKKGASRR